MMTPKEIYDKNVMTCKNEIQFVNDILEYERQIRTDMYGNSSSSTHSHSSPHTHTNTIAPCQSTASEKKWSWSKGQMDTPNYNQEGEKPMCYNKPSFPTVASVNVAALSQPTVEMTQRDFFADRIRQEVRRIEDKVLRPQFFMDAGDEPKNYLELIEKITTTDFTIDEEAAANVKRHPGYYGITYGLIWGKNKPDTEGFNEARKALKQAAQDAIDTATLSSADKLLGILNDFRNWTFKAEKAKK